MRSLRNNVAFCPEVVVNKDVAPELAAIGVSPYIILCGVLMEIAAKAVKVIPFFKKSRRFIFALLFNFQLFQNDRALTTGNL